MTASTGYLNTGTSAPGTWPSPLTGSATISTAPDKPATVTDKARNVLRLSADLAKRLAELEQRLWPAAKDQAENIKQAEPPALPWILEGAEQELILARDILEGIAVRL